MKRHAKTHRPHMQRLFAEPERPSDVHVANVDGAARNNPGPASYGIIIRRPDGAIAKELSKYIGVKTNNEAEYFGLIAALDYAASHGITRLRVLSDSELLVRQMQGHYKVKSAALRPLHERARKLAATLAYFSVEHVGREHNREADRLANLALDRTGAQRTAFSGQPSAVSEIRKAKIEKREPLTTQKIRARYAHGALHPAEPLDLPEGTEVEITLRKLAPD